MFTFFTDRDGKMQLESLAQSGFDPLSRTTRFMLMEEAHHMFVGESGVGRVVERTCEAMNQAGITDPYDIEKIRALGVIDLPTLQKKANLHYSLSLDLFGSEVSTNAANAYNAGIKGRYQEDKIEDDHQLLNDTYPVLKLMEGELRSVDENALTALNSRLRDDYSNDAGKGVGRWNKIIKKSGVDFEITLPHCAFHRGIGEFSNVSVTPEGQVISSQEFAAQRDQWLPSTEDGLFIASLMQPATKPGQYADWIAPPKVGIDKRPGDFEFVKLN
jgi:benzoyl-CoA 2,3-dioxygenase component B